MGVSSSIKQWYDQPFNSSGSALNWFLFVGLLVVISFLWSRIIATVQNV